ncbi:MAG: hypothetical protein CL526_07815 [Aequorivita sp.]|nr:hypothetical protein [Aequorivita sp.]
MKTNTKQPHKKKIILKENKNIHTIYYAIQIIVLSFFIGYYQPLYAQNDSDAIPDKNLKPYPYNLDKVWSNNVTIRAMSPDGNWFAFTEYFSVGENRMRLRNVNKESNQILPVGHKNIFSQNSKWFASLSADNSLLLINLETGNRKDFESVQQFNFSFDGQHLSLLQQKDNGTSVLKIIDLKTQKNRTIKNISLFTWNPKNHLMLFVQGDKNKNVFLYDVQKDSKSKIGPKISEEVNCIKWNENGSAAIIMTRKNEKIHLGVYYLHKSYIPLNHSLLKQQIPSYELANKEPFLSADGKTVLFFRIQKGVELRKDDKIEVWNTSDPLLYPDLKLREDYIYPYLLTAWYPKSETIKEIGTPLFPNVEMDIEHDFAIVYNELQYGSQNTEFLKADIYYKEIETGRMHLVVAAQPLTNLVSISPFGDYIVYFKNEDWWSYNVKNNKAVNITNRLKTSFRNLNNEYPKNRIEVFSKPGFLENNRKIIVADEYDLWAIDPNGKNAKRITKGREKNCRYFFKQKNDVEDYYQLTSGSFAGNKINLSKLPLLQTINYKTHSMGISLLHADLSITTLTRLKKSIFQIFKSPNNNSILYISESTTLPKALYHYNINDKKEKLIFQSNEELLNYDLGKKTFINYKVKGKELMGILMFPANYNPNKKYPLVVNIYEKISKNAMEFYPPTGYNYQGFSLLSYTTSGYFVLLPDITYEIGKPGLSAVESVNKAVDKTLEVESIDEKRMGLIGHSFGGYETAFIATQTNRFATYVAGAAATNVVSHYHGVNWNNSATDLWRYEDQQWRMGDSYYDNKRAYLENSPLEYVTNVTSPMLLWTGDKDYQVAWTQSLEMFIALRRLKKEASLILVKDEAHSPENTEKQLLLSTQVKKWLDKYLMKKENGES